MKKETKKNQILHRPEYPGGRKALLHTISSNLQYPEKAREAGVSGTVYLRYGINFKGEVVDVRVVKGIGCGCDEEATRVVKLLKFNVGKTRGVKVLFHRTIQIHFHPPKVAQPPAASSKAQLPPSILYQYEVSKTPTPKKAANRAIHYQITIKQD